MDRRTLLARSAAGAIAAVLGGCTTTSPAAVKTWRVAYLAGPTADEATEKQKIDAFVEALAALGYVREKNVLIDIYSSPVDAGGLSDAASKAASTQPDVIVAHAAPMAKAAKSITQTIPIVFASANAVVNGLVKDLARPEANATGSTQTPVELITKRLEILKEAVPSVRRVAYVWDRTGDPLSTAVTSLRAAGQRLGAEVVSVEGASVDDLIVKTASATEGADGMVVLIGAFTIGAMSQLIDLASRRRMPAVYPSGAADGGGLIAFGQDPAEQYRTAATYVDRILRGAKPSDLPVALPKQFEIVVNLRTAGEQGFTIPAGVLERATRVIR